MFDSRQYSWKDIKVNLLGRTVTGIQEIKYKLATEKDYVYGSGNEPRGIQSGNKKYDGKITLLQNELDALLDAVKLVDPTADITDISVDIPVSYGEGDVAKTDIIQGVEFMEAEKGMAQNDKFAKIDIPFMALGIKYNV